MKMQTNNMVYPFFNLPMLAIQTKEKTKANLSNSNGKKRKYWVNWSNVKIRQKRNNIVHVQSWYFCCHRPSYWPGLQCMHSSAGISQCVWHLCSAWPSSCAVAYMHLSLCMEHAAQWQLQLFFWKMGHCKGLVRLADIFIVKIHYTNLAFSACTVAQTFRSVYCIYAALGHPVAL